MTTNAVRHVKHDPVAGYWRECIGIAADECGLTLTDEQLNYMADAVRGGSENYGTAFYSPPASDRYADMQSDFDRRLAEQKRDSDRREEEARRLDEDRVRTIRRQAWTIQSLREGRSE